MFPIFESGHIQEKESRIVAKISSNRKQIQELLLSPDPTYSSFLIPYQSINTELSTMVTELAHLDSVCNSDETGEAYSRLLPQLSDYYTELGQNQKIFEAFSFIQIHEKDLNSAQKKVLENEIRDFRLSGVHLPGAEKARLKTLRGELSTLSHNFSQNVLKATNSFTMVCTEEDMIGLPEGEKKRFLQPDGTYAVSLQFPSYIAYMTYADKRSKREELYKAYVTRAPENGKLIEEILTKRTEEAKLLGFSNYASLSLASKMAESTDQVFSFLKHLGDLAKPHAEKELQELKTFATTLGIASLESHDLLYVSEKWKKQKLNYDEEMYKPYLEKNKVIQGTFSFLESLFGIRFQKADTPVWHPSVSSFDILVENEVRSRIYLDLEARKEKKSGAWMNNWKPRYRSSKGEIHLPVAFVVANFPQESDGIPSLWKPSDVVTFFHELGHALHHLLSEIEEAFVSGVNGVEWDAVEFPSQFLENFAYEPKVLKQFARHYQTGEEIPDSFIDTMVQSKNFQSAMGVLRQLEFAIFDLELHCKIQEFSEEHVQSLLDSIRKKTSVMFPPNYNKFQNTFSHIFSGGYAAGYYSYKWAELLSANAFFQFIDHGIFDAELTNSFRKKVLSKGGSRNAMELFQDFFGKPPEVEALLRLNGIAA